MLCRASRIRVSSAGGLLAVAVTYRSINTGSTNSEPPASPVVLPQPDTDYNVSAYKAITKFSDLPQTFGHNQHMAIDAELKEQLRQVLWHFRAPIRYAFAYGSGVFSQGPASTATHISKPQVDFIFGVKHTEHWHSLNMKYNPHHYSSLRLLGSGVVSAVQDRLGAGVYFNPFVTVNGMNIKYGVVNLTTLLRDVADWDSLYLAGRLHKPVKILRDEPQVRFANQANLISVLRAALLLLPEQFSELELYKTIAGVSYMGDPRMAYGENPHKVRNIVETQFLNFRKLYTPLMDGLPNLDLMHAEGSFTISSSEQTLESTLGTSIATLKQDMDPVRRGNMVIRLPVEFRAKLYRQYASKFGGEVAAPAEGASTGGDIEKRIAADEDLVRQMSKSIRSTVMWPSLSQSVKGVFTAGVVRSIRYSSDKLRKYYAAK